MKSIKKEDELLQINNDIKRLYNNFSHSGNPFCFSWVFLKIDILQASFTFDDSYIKNITLNKAGQPEKNSAFFKYLNDQFPKSNLLQYLEEKQVLDFTELVLDDNLFYLFRTIETLKFENNDNLLTGDTVILKSHDFYKVSEQFKTINKFVKFIESKLNKNLDKKLVEDFLFEYEKDKENDEEIILKEKELLELKSKVRELEADNDKLCHEKRSYFEVEEKNAKQRKKEKGEKKKTLFSTILNYFD